jgi:retinol dehydrogenase-12
MAKPVCLITGATEGVGKATAQALARKGFTLVLAARSLAKAENVKREVAAASGAEDIDIVVGDLNSLRQVRQMARTSRSSIPRKIALCFGYQHGRLEAARAGARLRP